jgi:peptide/nickel transport system permease protein
MSVAEATLKDLKRRVSAPAPALALALLVVVLVLALTSPFLPYEIGRDVNVSMASQGPGAGHWLGTDHLGRDTFARWWIATRAFMFPGLVCAALSLLIGVPVGAVAGWVGGPVGMLVRFALTVVSTVPRVVLVLLVAAISGGSLWVLAATLGLAAAPAIAETVYRRIETLRAADFVVAQRAHGVPGYRVLWVHLVMAACGPMIAAHAVRTLGGFLVLETTLSYLGTFGVVEPMPSWGNMLAFEWGRVSVIGVMLPAISVWVVVLATWRLAHDLGATRE